MEFTEYLPSEESAKYYNRKCFSKQEKKMKVLTRNIVLFRECTNKKECGVIDSMSIEELRDYGCEEECHNCGAQMVISQEALIKN